MNRMVDYLPLLKAIEALLARADVDLQDYLASMGYKNPKNLVDAIENVQDVLEAILSDYENRLLDELGKCKSKEDLLEKWESVKEDTEFQQSTSDAITGVLLSYALLYLDEYLKYDDKDLSGTEISKKAIGRTLELADITAASKIGTVNNYLDGALQECEAEVEKSAKGASKLIEFGKKVLERILSSKIFERLTNCRSTATATVLAYESIIQQEAISQNPSVKRKRWCHNGSENPRENHIDMDGVESDADGVFMLTGRDGGIYYIEYPRDCSLPSSESVNCHCTVESVIDEDILSWAAETKSQVQHEIVLSINESYENEADQSLLSRIGSWIADLFTDE